MEHEEVIWSGSPSQILNFKYFLGFAVWFFAITALFVILKDQPSVDNWQPALRIGYLGLTVVPFLNIFWRWLQIKCTRYELTNQRLKTKYGVLSRKADELELYRVKDYKFDQPFFLRIFSLANIVLESSDRSHPLIVIKAIRNADDMRDKIRSCVEGLRERKKVTEIDFE